MASSADAHPFVESLVDRARHSRNAITPGASMVFQSLVSKITVYPDPSFHRRERSIKFIRYLLSRTVLLEEELYCYPSGFDIVASHTLKPLLCPRTIL